MKKRYRLIVVGAVSAFLLGAGVAVAQAATTHDTGACVTCWEHSDK